MNTVDTLQKYGNSFQTKTLVALLTDGKLIDELDGIISVDFFESDANKWILDTILEYHKKYRKPPTLDVFKVEISQLTNDILSKTVVDQLKEIYKQIGTVDLDYIKSEFKEFCINQNLKEVIIQSVDLLKLGNYDKIKTLVDDAMKVGNSPDLGLDYIKDFDKRSSNENRYTVPTPWKPITDLMDGGLGSGELAVVVSSSGGGKCVGGNTKIDIEYDEIGFELENGYIIWQKPWDVIQLNDDISITASEALKLIELRGSGKTM